MFPVYDVVRSTLSIIKVGLFIAFLALYIAFAPDIVNILSNIIDMVNPSLSAVNGLDLGCFASLIGLDVFLNNVILLIITASGVYISAIASVLTIKYSIVLFSLVMRV